MRYHGPLPGGSAATDGGAAGSCSGIVRKVGKRAISVKSGKGAAILSTVCDV